MELKTFKISILSLFFCTTTYAQNLNSVHTLQAPKTQNKLAQSYELSLLNYTELLKVKQNINTSKFSTVYNTLLKVADSALKEGVFSVMQKTQVPPSGSKHDYISIGPYWWPDSNKTNGLPWIRKDGEVNPLTRQGSTDYEIKNKMFHNTNNLALAYFFSDDLKYAKKAAELINVWFLNKDTKMNPNLNFAQGIPGINLGRGIGIIEFAGITEIITAIEILEMNAHLNEQDVKQLKQWFTDYLNWLQTSENGIFEKNTKNNHATHYDVQVVSILLFLNREAEAKKVLEIAKTKRIATQIQPNGSQPHELARTKSLSYCTMNLSGFTELAFLGTKVNVDLWNYEADNGASIKKAFEYLKPYVKEEKKWEYTQINSFEKATKSLKNLFTRAGSQFNNQEYCTIGKTNNTKAISLLYHCF